MSAIRVASVPAAHPYVEHLGTLGVVRQADPATPGGRWWPPAMVDPAWILAQPFDLLHMHFGTESFSPSHLEDTVAALRATGRPLVYTVHDLSNPQLADQAAHVAQLDVLVPAADALVTLTHGAAADIAARWGRRAEVIAHPHVLPLDAEPPAGRAGPERVVGLHLRDLRPNVDGPGATATLIAAVRELRGAGAHVVVRVELHDQVRDDRAREAVRRACGQAPWVTLAERPRPDDGALLGGLADLDVCVLPYRHGTHSGWLELCWDLGVPVAVPAVGHMAEQHDDPSVAAFAPGSSADLARVLSELLGVGGPPRSRPGSAARRETQARRGLQRREQQHQIAEAHLALYRRVLAVSARRAVASLTRSS